MEKQGKWLKNDFIKISNPLKIKKNSIKTECDSDSFDFVTQQENYNLLKQSFEPFGIFFRKVYATRWSTSNNLEKTDKYVFVVESNSPVVWYKYESDGYGSGQNYLYLGKTKLKLSEWLAQFNFEQRTNLINLMNNSVNKNNLDNLDNIDNENN